MNRRLAGVLLAVLLGLGGLALVVVLRGGDGAAEETLTEERQVAPPEETLTGTATLYFPDENGMLSPEDRPIPAAATDEALARTVLEAVLAGPTGPGRVAPFPENTTLGATYLAPTGVLYVDLVSSEHPRPPAQGSAEEMLSIFSLVNSVLLNVSGIDSVALLWNGRQPRDFSGHVDTSLPLRADRDLLARRS